MSHRHPVGVPITLTFIEILGGFKVAPGQAALCSSASKLKIMMLVKKYHIVIRQTHPISSMSLQLQASKSEALGNCGGLEVNKPRCAATVMQYARTRQESSGSALAGQSKGPEPTLHLLCVVPILQEPRLRSSYTP